MFKFNINCKNKDCSKEITIGSKSGYCGSCSAKERLKNPKNNPMYGKHPKHTNPNCQCASCKSIRSESKSKNNGNYKEGNYTKDKIHYCIDNCNKKVSKKGNRCKSCARKEEYKDPKNRIRFIKKGKNNPSYKDGRTLKEYYCIKCNIKITKISGLYGKGFCIKCKSKGKNNSNWKGGISSLSLLLRTSHKYNNWRKIIFERDNYKCQECSQVGKKLEIHHIKLFSIILSEFLAIYSQFSPIEDKETLIRLSEFYGPFWEINNGITLCKKCHDKKDIH